ncbi:unnamed protein product [Spirodela intermedia]|uniref:Uncharacterized protein n=1 Tax=Spirodela intermedia TaxID=51605 RepID=A0ABN7EEF8_SPIIN|nr:unnamed protein product [Spirodela intermedia]CAA6674509.1 unnamed protein product [Spirodela intermedia]CAA6675759.1 unnamed protein product [Spirodela intermedia]
MSHTSMIFNHYSPMIICLFHHIRPFPF